MGDLSREPSMEDILSSIRRVIARDESPQQIRDSKAGAPQDVLELQDEDDHTPDTETSDNIVESAAEELVSNVSAEATRQSLEALTAVITPDAATAAAPAPRPGGRSMEDVVIEAMRPMLKQWLDTNLPGMVEAMVAKEISRITGRRF